MQKPRNIIFIFSVLALCAASFAYAQSVVPDPVQYVVAPQTPGPNQSVTIQAEGVGGFLGSATITWLENGKVVLSGVGASAFSFTTGALGTQTHIQVKIVSSSQGNLTRDFIFLPSLINLVWEADTTAPPLYRGKPLYSAGSNVKVAAFPTVLVNGKQIPSNNLSMQWSLNDQAMPNQSGLGRTTFSFPGDQLQSAETVSVDAYYGSSQVGHADITIPASQPLLYFYTKDPLRGTLYDAALPSGISLGAAEFTIQAVPYFFANSSLASGALVYNWTLNGEDSSGPDSAKGILTLRQAGTGQGSAAIGANATEQRRG